MSDPSNSKPASIPSWQRQQQSPEIASTAERSDQSSQASSEAPSRTALLDKASKFLGDDEIREASSERKISFLEGKGLTNEEIQKLLGLSRNKQDVKPVLKKIATEQQEFKFIQPARETPQSTEASQEPAILPSKEIPPIITYPEFLLHSQKPPPLITAQRLLTIAYVVSGAASLTYGTSKYIVEPMIESLASARHSLFEAVAEDLNILIEKLEAAVSTIPDDQKPTPDPEEDAEELGATAFFHRSTGTQTSPRLSRANSSSSESLQKQPSVTENQSARLQDLQEELKDLLNPSYAGTKGLEPGKHMKNKIDDFRRYLDGLVYGSAETVPGFSGNKGKEDGIAKVKAEIRQTKGVLLSSRNFPSSVALKGWGTA